MVIRPEMKSFFLKAIPTSFSSTFNDSGGNDHLVAKYYKYINMQHYDLDIPIYFR